MASRNFVIVSAALIFATIAIAQPQQEAKPAEVPAAPAKPTADAKPAVDAKSAAETKPASEAEAPPADKGDAKWGPTSSKELKICDLYESAAVLKAKAKTEVSATCACTQTKAECGKNWRGAMKYEFDCKCELRGSCEVTKCAGSDITATAKASATCRKSNCSCVKQGEAACGKGLMGGEKHNYVCKCP